MPFGSAVAAPWPPAAASVKVELHLGILFQLPGSQGCVAGYRMLCLSTRPSCSAARTSTVAPPAPPHSAPVPAGTASDSAPVRSRPKSKK